MSEVQVLEDGNQTGWVDTETGEFDYEGESEEIALAIGAVAGGDRQRVMESPDFSDQDIDPVPKYEKVFGEEYLESIVDFFDHKGIEFRVVEGPDEE